MRIAKLFSLAAILMLCFSGSLWADSVKQSDVLAAFSVTNNGINQNLKAFESNSVLKSEYLTASLLDLAGVALWPKHRLAAEADFAAAINNLKLVASGLSVSPSNTVPDASSLSLLACSGLLLFGAMKRKFSN